MVMTRGNAVFWDVTPWDLVEIKMTLLFDVGGCFHFHGRRNCYFMIHYSDLPAPPVLLKSIPTELNVVF